MEQEMRSDDTVDDTENYFDENSEGEENESQTFGLDDIDKRRCGRCKLSPLLPYVYEGFTVLYCVRCKKPICTQCRYPALELAPASAASNTSGLICTKCRKVYMHTPAR